MADISLTDWVGYFASLLLMISFLMKKFQYVSYHQFNRAVIFIIYGIMHLLAYHEHLYFSSEHILLNKVLPKFWPHAIVI
jgi:predicted ferric reductase